MVLRKGLHHAVIFPVFLLVLCVQEFSLVCRLFHTGDTSLSQHFRLGVASANNFNYNDEDTSTTSTPGQQRQHMDPNFIYEQAIAAFDDGKYDDAPLLFWQAILSHGDESNFTIEDVFQKFMNCYKKQGNVALGYLFVADQYSARGNYQEAKMYAEATLAIDPTNVEARSVLAAAKDGLKGGNAGGGGGNSPSTTPKTSPKTSTKTSPDEDTPESLYNEAGEFFGKKQYSMAAMKNQESCDLSKGKLSQACANAIYCRSNVCDWGPNGTLYDKDLKTLERITRSEISRMRYVDHDGKVKWSHFAAVHPHMTLGYDLNDGRLKKMIAESYALTDVYYGVAEVTGPDKFQEALIGYPLDQSVNRPKYKRDRANGAKIKVGYLGVGFSSKAVIFLAQDVFRFHDKSRFETHVFSTGKADHVNFIKGTMRGVDWRKRVEQNADYFHDVQYLRDQGPIALADYISSLGIHILVDWDGYARQGERAQGIFHLRPAPVQIMHQEFLGTPGANFDYIVTDQLVSPLRLENDYAEKFIYMPHHFFCKGHRMQKEVIPPRLAYQPKNTSTSSYVQGEGTPQQNKCGVSNKYHDVSFVFCNFNKFLKFNPPMFRLWLRILERVPDSQICLLGNPKEGIAFLLQFINEFNSDLIDRVSFLDWENNPFDHQQRSFDMCNAVLDSHPYNGHTTGMDALYAGLPIVTRSDGVEMGSRVITSANMVLGTPELNAPGGIDEYEEIAVRLGTDDAFYNSMRKKLVKAALQDNPMHPFWDMKRYTKNLEQGMEKAWDKFLNAEDPDHIYVEDEEDGIGMNDEL